MHPVVVGPNCYSGADGAFAFTVTVAHARPRAIVALEPVSRVSLTGSLTASVRSAVGSPISDPRLLLHLFAIWKDPATGVSTPHLLASGVPRQGLVRFAFRLPPAARGTNVVLEVSGGGRFYRVGAGRAVTVAVS